MSLPFDGRQAWALLAGIIVAYEVACDEEDLLSCVVDRWLVDHPVVTRAAIGAVALHLLNALPAYVDPLAKSFWRRIFGCRGNYGDRHRTL